MQNLKKEKRNENQLNLPWSDSLIAWASSAIITYILIIINFFCIAFNNQLSLADSLHHYRRRSKKIEPSISTFAEIYVFQLRRCQLIPTPSVLLSSLKTTSEYSITLQLTPTPESTISETLTSPYCSLAPTTTLLSSSSLAPLSNYQPRKLNHHLCHLHRCTLLLFSRASLSPCPFPYSSPIIEQSAKTKGRQKLKGRWVILVWDSWIQILQIMALSYFHSEGNLSCFQANPNLVWT